MIKTIKEELYILFDKCPDCKKKGLNQYHLRGSWFECHNCGWRNDK